MVSIRIKHLQNVYGKLTVHFFHRSRSFWTRPWRNFLMLSTWWNWWQRWNQLTVHPTLLLHSRSANEWTYSLVKSGMYPCAEPYSRRYEIRFCIWTVHSFQKCHSPGCFYQRCVTFARSRLQWWFFHYNPLGSLKVEVGRLYGWA